MKNDIHTRIYSKINVLTGGLEGFIKKAESYKKLNSEGFMDLIVEHIPPDKISISHYYGQCGDLVSDPDMLVRIDIQNKTAEALTYQDSYTYQEVYPKYPDMSVFRPKLKKELNTFLNQWLSVLKNQGFYR